MDAVAHLMLTNCNKKQPPPRWMLFILIRAENWFIQGYRKKVLNPSSFQKTYRKWSDRKAYLETLLSSYVFVKVVPKEFIKVYKTNGVVKFVSFEGQLVAIPQKQIDNLHDTATRK